MSHLTEAEREALGKVQYQRTDLYAAVERILADRLRAVEAENERLRADHHPDCRGAVNIAREDRRRAEADLAAERAKHEALRARVAAACDKAEALTQDAIGAVSEHWRGRDYADGLDAGIETTTGLVRALLDADTAGGA